MKRRAFKIQKPAAALFQPRSTRTRQKRANQSHATFPFGKANSQIFKRYNNMLICKKKIIFQATVLSIPKSSPIIAGCFP
jgi:hypothetical protein